MNIVCSTILKIPQFRKRILAYLKAHYFHEIGHSLPLGNGYWVNLWQNDAYDSFSEIFIQQEYFDYIPNTKINHIIDIGAHYGYFSLWLQSQYPKQNIHSLLIEASPSCAKSLARFVKDEKLKGKFKFLYRAVNDPSEDFTEFYDRPYMAASLFSSLEQSDAKDVKTLKVEEVFHLMPPPFDLIKCDIEGSEWKFITNYKELIKNTRYLLLEWHSWHSGGGGYKQLEKQLTKSNFHIVKSSTPTPAQGRSGFIGLFLAENLTFQN
jgi:FkbM family methyltransferase